MITADQLVAHAIGDYVLQSDWMATEKTTKHTAAAVHAVVYTFCFLPFTIRLWQLALIAGTHFLIDRYRLARYIVWLKNCLAPRVTVTVEYTTAFVGAGGKELYDEQQHIHRWWRPWAECQATGYPPERPIWLAVWLLSVADNLCHILTERFDDLDKRLDELTADVEHVNIRLDAILKLLQAWPAWPTSSLADPQRLDRRDP